MNKSYCVVGVVLDTGELQFLMQDGTFTPAYYRAFQYPTYEAAKTDAQLVTESITRSYGRFLEQVQENAMPPSYAPGKMVTDKAVYDNGLKVYTVNVRVVEA